MNKDHTMSNEFPWLQRQLEQDLLSDQPSTALTGAEVEAFASITAGQQILPWADRLRFVTRALGRKALGGG